MVDFVKVKDRLEQMIWLPPNWDGFESQPIDPRAYEICKKMLVMLEDFDGVSEIKIFAGVEVPGSMLLVMTTTHRIMEMIVHPNTQITYDEFISGMCIGSGAFYLTQSNLNAILT